jgi:hypothetical protein
MSSDRRGLRLRLTTTEAEIEALERRLDVLYADKMGLESQLEDLRCQERDAYTLRGARAQNGQAQRQAPVRRDRDA